MQQKVKIEAALVKVPTIASNFGAFKNVIQHNQTGLLCTNITDWYLSLKVLIESENLRKNLGENAYNICKKKYNTIQTGIKLANYITSFSNKHIGFFLPSLQISRDIYAILKHACFLQDEGWDVDLIYSDVEIKFFEFEGHNFNAINLNNSIMTSHYDIIVASFFKTFFSFFNYSRTIKHLYIIQNYEKDFYLYTNYIIILEIKMKKLIPFLLELIILQVQITPNYDI